MAPYVLLPLLLLGAAGATGFGTAWVIGGVRGRSRQERDRLELAVGLAVAIPIVAASCVLVDRLPELSTWYGDFLQRLVLWAAAAFLVGLVLGGIYSWHAKGE